MSFQIFADSKTPGRCRSCAAVIMWAELTSGNRHPFDLPINTDAVQENFVTGRTIETIDAISHFATCPQANQWRSPR